jgi:hypothetical protein
MLLNDKIIPTKKPNTLLLEPTHKTFILGLSVVEL